MIGSIGHTLAVAGSMTWEIVWALILGFALSAMVQAVVRKSTVVRLLGDDRPSDTRYRRGIGCGVVIVLVCGCRVGALAVS